jgi:hypothetical protein
MVVMPDGTTLRLLLSLFHDLACSAALIIITFVIVRWTKRNDSTGGPTS